MHTSEPDVSDGRGERRGHAIGVPTRVPQAYGLDGS
jgi:hypothetical protein